MPKSLPIEEYFRTPASAYALAAFGILVAPLVEELFFRGFLFPALARPLGVGIAMVITAGGFALIHSEQLAHAWAPLLVLFAVGLVLTAVRAKTKSVAVCVLIHVGYNCALFTLVFIATGGFRHMERA
jgi:membrane protease YdiL (CAAX protease family)